MGDLYVLGAPLIAQYSAMKSGHGLNNKLLRALIADPANYEVVTFENERDCPVDFWPKRTAMPNEAVLEQLELERGGRQRAALSRRSFESASSSAP